MKNVRLVVATFATVLLSFSAGAATEYIRADGVWWGTVPPDAKTFAVPAMIDAYLSGWDSGSAYATAKIALQLGKNARPGDRETATVAIMKIGTRAQTNGKPEFPRTYGFYKAALTDFYESHPGAEIVTVGTVLSCLDTHPDLSCDEVAKYAGSH